MADNKKSFLFYCDWQETFNALPNEKAGELIKHLLAYVNDENPESNDILINAVFANIKHTLKRDLKKWEQKSYNRSEAGKAGAKARWQSLNKNGNRINDMAKMAVKDNVIDNVIDNDSIIDIEKLKIKYLDSHS